MVTKSDFTVACLILKPSQKRDDQHIWKTKLNIENFSSYRVIQCVQNQNLKEKKIKGMNLEHGRKKIKIYVSNYVE